MSQRPRLQLAPEAFDLDMAPNGAVRQAVGKSGRLHVDRSLHFLVLNRQDRPGTSLARNVALHSSAYLVWEPADDLAAEMALHAVVERMLEKFERILLISLYDQPEPPLRREDDPHLPPFVVWVGAGDEGCSEDLARHLGEAVEKIEIDLRQAQAESPPFVQPEHPHRVGRFHELEEV